MSALSHRIINKISLQSLAWNHVLFYGEKRPAKRLQRFNWANHQRLKRSLLMSMIPITVIFIFLQGGAL